MGLLFSLNVAGAGTTRYIAKKGDTEWYLFDDDKTTKKRGEIAPINTKENIVARVTLLYYLKNEEATMKKLAEKAQEKLVQEVDHGYDVGTEESKEQGDVGAGGRPWI